MKNKLAHIVSIVFIPLLLPTYLFAIILFNLPELAHISSINDKLILLLSLAIVTILLPVTVVFVLYKFRVISSLFLVNREDRKTPQLISLLLYGIFTIFLFLKYGSGNILSVVMAINTVSLLAIAIITNYWKISTHTSGAMGFSAILLVLLIKYFSVGLLVLFLLAATLTIAVFYARLYLKAHTLKQVLLGGLLGTISGLCLIFFI